MSRASIAQSQHSPALQAREIENLGMITVPGVVLVSRLSLGRMEGAKVMAMAVCALVVLAMAGDVQAQCSMSQLSQCTSAVTSGANPSPQCCSQVGAIVDFDCFCRMVQSNQRSIPQAFINNAVAVPMKCGAQGQKLRNRQCGNIHIP